MRFPIITSVILFASLSSVVTAQFGFFDHMFGAHQGQQQRQQQPPHAGSQWTAHAEAGSCGLLACLMRHSCSSTVSCSSYLCPDSLVCVARPSECPCPREEDIKCIVPDAEDTEAGRVVCVSGASGCADVERLARAH
ncbi:hypothetical protein OG21DRAFT_1505885 [Imleria badia]|nr:hypothetical protein OG21DRAFT_1505885 [Imleria badia]